MQRRKDTWAAGFSAEGSARAWWRAQAANAQQRQTSLSASQQAPIGRSAPAAAALR